MGSGPLLWYFPPSDLAFAAVSSSVLLLACSCCVAAVLCTLFCLLVSACCGRQAPPFGLVVGWVARCLGGGLNPLVSGRVVLWVALHCGRVQLRRHGSADAPWCPVPLRIVFFLLAQLKL